MHKDSIHSRQPDDVSTPAADWGGRRFVGALLTLVTPGLGHFLFGHFARGVVWAVIVVGLALSIPVTTVVGVYLGILARVAAVADVLRVVHRRPPWGRVVAGCAAILIGSAVMWSVIRTYWVQAFQIPSGAMEPTLVVGDYLFTNNAVYRFRSPQRGDIITFRYPLDERQTFIKRCVASGGQRVEIRDKVLYVDGRQVDEPYVTHADSRILSRETGPRDNFGPVVVPPGQVFMLGDNRDNSHDSRFWGALPRNLVIGKAIFLYWSWDSRAHGPRLDRIGLSLEGANAAVPAHY